MVIPLVVPGLPFDQLPSTLNPPVLIFDVVFVPFILLSEMVSIVNRAVLDGVKVRLVLAVATLNRQVCAPLALTAGQVNPPTDGVIVPTVQFEIT